MVSAESAVGASPGNSWAAAADSGADTGLKSGFTGGSMADTVVALLA